MLGKNIYKNKSDSLLMAEAMPILPDAIFVIDFGLYLETQRSNFISLTDNLM